MRLLRLAFIACTILLGGCDFRVDKFWHLSGPAINDGGYYVLSLNVINCPPTDQRGQIPGVLGPNTRPNGFILEWRLKDHQQTISISNISGTITSPDGSERTLDVPFKYWYGEHTISRDIFYAFASRGGYSDLLTEGKYLVKISYTLNGKPFSDIQEVVLTKDRKAGVHAPFYSHYF